MIVTLPATEVRVHFGDVLRRVNERGERVVVERGGKPQAVVLSIDDFENLTRHESDVPDWRQLVVESREGFAKAFEGKPLPDIDQIFHEMREERDAQILSNLH